MQPTVQPLLRDALDNGDVAQAITICGSAPGMLTNILAAGLARIGEDHYDAEKIDKAMEEASIEEVNEGMKPLTYLSGSRSRGGAGFPRQVGASVRLNENDCPA